MCPGVRPGPVVPAPSEEVIDDIRGEADGRPVKEGKALPPGADVHGGALGRAGQLAVSVLVYGVGDRSIL